MASYQDVKREGAVFSYRLLVPANQELPSENMRRMFYKWLNAARKARLRKQALFEAEVEMRRRFLINAWDTWRGHYQTEQLLPLVRTYRRLPIFLRYN